MLFPEAPTRPLRHTRDSQASTVDQYGRPARLASTIDQWSAVLVCRAELLCWSALLVWSAVLVMAYARGGGVLRRGVGGGVNNSPNVGRRGLEEEAP